MKSSKKKKSNLIKLEKIFLDIKKIKYKENIIVSEILDSIEILDFIAKIEKTFQLEIDQKKINEKNFRSLETISHFVLNDK
jgi:acyl carrier protein